MAVSFNDWKKLDIRVGEIKEIKDHPDADKLFILEVDVGGESKTLVTGLKDYYNKKELLNKKIVVFCNLEPAKFRGIKSEGMLLAAVSGKEKCVLLAPEKDIENGAKIE